MNALDLQEAATATDPVDLRHHLDAAKAAADADDWDAVRDHCERGLESDPEDIETLFLAGVAAFHQGDLAGAASMTLNALQQDTDVQEFARALSVYYALAGEISSSLYYGKLSSALVPQDRFASLMPESFPRFETVFKNISDNPLLERARQAVSSQAWDHAETWYRQHLTFRPDDVEAHLGLATTLQMAGQLRSALEGLRGARHVAPDDPRLAGMLGNVLARLGAFDESRACHDWACRGAPESVALHAAALQDGWLDPELSTDEQVARIRSWGERFGVSSDEAPWFPTPAPKDRLTIGYVVGGLGSTMTGVNLSAILAKHDPTRFQTVGFGLGTLSDNANLTFQKCMDRWHDVNGIDPITFGAMVAAEEIDILVDASGFGTPVHLSAFGARMAPCQVSWLGAPVGTGLAAMDYVLTDSVIEGDGSDGLRESPALLSLGATVAVPLGQEQGPVPAREGNGIVFAADATMSELNPRTIALWSRALHAVPDSSLVLRDHVYQGGESLDRLIALFGDFGLAHRVDIIASSLPGEFYAQADVALMPVPYPRAQAVTDALWSGVPVICLGGNGRLSRQAASALHHLGHGEDMVAADADAFVARAVDWGSDADRRNALRATVRDRMGESPSLDTAQRVRDLESALTTLWQRTCDAA